MISWAATFLIIAIIAGVLEAAWELLFYVKQRLNR